MAAKILRHPLVQEALAKIIGLYLGFVLRTTRWDVHGMELLEQYATHSPAIFACWHEHLPLMPALWRAFRRLPDAKNRQISLLTSKSRDGRLIATIMRRFGASTVSGSSSRGGRGALRNLLGTLESGEHVGLTPDGPRGPRRRANAGVAQLAALSGAPILPCAAYICRGRRMGSWDQMVLPAPFGRGVIVCGAPIFVARSGWREATGSVELALTAASDRAGEIALCGSASSPPRPRSFRQKPAGSPE